MPTVDERVRDLEIADAGRAVEVKHLGDAVEKAAKAFEAHAIADGKTHGAMRSENRRFLVAVFVLVLAAVVGQFFR
jgi:hypothetical protein